MSEKQFLIGSLPWGTRAGHVGIRLPVFFRLGAALRRGRHPGSLWAAAGPDGLLSHRGPGHGQSDRAMVHLDYNCEKFPEIEKKYLGEVVIDIPANVGSGLLYSLSDKRTALDVVREFEFELLDAYFPRAMRANEENRRRCAAG